MAPDERWGVWEVLYGHEMRSSSGDCIVGDTELSLTLALVRALMRCPIDVRGGGGDGGVCLSVKDAVVCKA